MTVTYETIRQPRKMTAAEAAERLGVTPRTIRRYQAEAREDFLSRAAERQRTAYELHMQGYTWQEVGEQMECSAAAARQLGHRWRTANGIEPQDFRFHLRELLPLLRNRPIEPSAERYKFHMLEKPEEMTVSLSLTREEYAAVLAGNEYDFRTLDDTDTILLRNVIHKLLQATLNYPRQKRPKAAALHG